MSHIWHDLVHAFTHADKGMLFTIRELALRPGVVAREYVKGRRKRYYNPFSLLVIILGIYILANSVFKPYSQLNMGPADPTVFKTESKRAKFEAIRERQRSIGEFINSHVNIVLFISTPYLAFILWLMFRRRGYNYAEHLTAVTYTNAFLSILTILIFGPLMYFIPDRSAKQMIYYSMLLVHILYIAFMYYGFMGYTSGKSYFKTLGAATLALVAWSIFSGLIIMVYIITTVF